MFANQNLLINATYYDTLVDSRALKKLTFLFCKQHSGKYIEILKGSDSNSEGYQEIIFQVSAPRSTKYLSTAILAQKLEAFKLLK